MIKFLLKGILLDKSRSLLPVIVVSIGVILTVIIYCWLKGILGESITMNANFTAGHVKVMTRAYAKQEEQMPNDLAIMNAGELVKELKASYPDIDWVERIRFGGLMDIPDKNGETRAQGPAAGWAIDLLSHSSKEKERFNIVKSLISGRLPSKPGEALISSDFAKKFNLKPGGEFTLFGSTMDGAMAFKNFRVAGLVRFGATSLDRGAVIIDIKDAQAAFNMEDAAGEILGYFEERSSLAFFSSEERSSVASNNFKDARYDEEKATEVASSFNSKYRPVNDEYAPVMLRLSDQGGMGSLINYSNAVGTFMVFIFVMAMSVVLWNTGLLGGLRRYNEFGLRLALGEEKKHIYKTLIYEGLLIGAIGSIAGTAIGLGAAYYLQAVGLDMGSMMENSSMMMPSVVRAQITPTAFYIGFIPGLFSMVLGNALSGIGIYKRKTAQLFKELEA